MTGATCGVAGCARPALVLGRRLCHRHYRRWQRHGDPLVGRINEGAPLAVRMAAHTDRDGPVSASSPSLGPCWLWTGSLKSGYGSVKVDGRALAAHRVSFELAKGPIAAGMEVDHLCRTRACVNPDHLEPVTRAENIRRTWPFRADYRGGASCRS